MELDYLCVEIFKYLAIKYQLSPTDYSLPRYFRTFTHPASEFMLLQSGMKIE